MKTCLHGNSAPTEVIDALSLLSDYQGGFGRHKCVICAYAEGEKSGLLGQEFDESILQTCAHDSSAPMQTMKDLPTYQGGVGRHLCAYCAYRQGYEHGVACRIETDSFDVEVRTHGLDLDNFIPEEEGRAVLREHIAYERRKKNRAAAIEKHGTICKACAFDFNKTYGIDYAKDYIEIHHTTSITKLAGKQISIETDLIPLCSNCHSMAHRKSGVILNLEDIKTLLKNTGAGTS